MRVGIDGNEANVRRRVGIGEYAFQLLREFSRASDETVSFEIFLKSKKNHGMPEERQGWRYKVFGPGVLWTKIALPLRLRFTKDKPDVFFSPTHYSPQFSPIPTAISIMDLSYHFYPELFRRKDLYQLVNWTKDSAKKASVIFTISEASKQDIIRIYDVSESRVVVTYPGIKSFASLTPRVYPIHMLENDLGVKKPYFLFVGTIQPRKNIIRLIEAFSRVVEKEPDTSLVIVGKRGWLYQEILAAPEKYGVASRVSFLEEVSDDQLQTLYKNAEAFILPSLYEGFGLPVLEAMQNECPVITSNVSSLPEAGGNACLYVDPEDVGDIAKKMEQILGNPKLRNELIEKGKKQAAKFSWEKTAAITLEALRNVVNGKYER